MDQKHLNKSDGAVRMALDFVHHNPGEAPTVSRYLDPAELESLGFAGQVCNLHVQAGVTMQSFDSELWQGHEEELEWVQNYAQSVRAAIQATKRHALTCFAWTDLLVLPKALVARYQSEIVSSVQVPDEWGIKGDFTPDIHHPQTQKILRIQIREIFQTFPELDGLVVRVGESYFHDLPHHTGGDPILNGVESHVVLLNILREEICERLDRSLIYRTWMSGIDENVETYLETGARVEPHSKLIFSIKHCVGDYHRLHPFSPPLGKGRHQQIVEVQCQREYEGKGAFPNFIAAGVIDGFEEDVRRSSGEGAECLRDLLEWKGFAGVLTWSRGGGWLGPYLKDELWCDINAQVLVRWGREPERSTGELLDDVLTDLGFSDGDRPAMQELLHLSTQAVLCGVTGTRGEMASLWTRDEFFGGYEEGAPQMRRSVDAILKNGTIEETLTDLKDAVGLWQRIETLAAGVCHENREREDFIRTSCTYGRLYQEVICSAWTVILLGESGVRTGVMDSARVARASEDYRQAWADWGALALRPECPTLYRDTYCRYVQNKGMEPVPGMGASVARYRELASSLVLE